MNKILVTAFLAMALPLGAAHATVIQVNFDNVSGFNTTGTGYPEYTSDDIGGIIFDRDVQILSVASAGAAGPGQSGNVAREAVPPFGGFPRGGDVGGTFDGFTVSTLSLVVGDSGGDLDIFELLGFDASGNQIVTSGVKSSNSAIPISISAAGIASFLLKISDLPDNDGSSFFDNFEFDTEVAAVPSPATLPLLGFGLAFLIANRHRRKG